MQKTDVLLGFGSNLGDRRQTLDDAWDVLSQMPGIETVRISRYYETEPVGGPDGQPNYLNAVGLIRTTLTPLELLGVLQEIEHRFGRVRTERWGPRTLDLDILLFGMSVLRTETLTIPHPEMLGRRFVLEPANEIAPNMIHPTSGLKIEELLFQYNVPTDEMKD